MDWQPLESKLLASSAYDPGKHILYLRFLSGEVYRELLEAESPGRYFLRSVRNRFRYERMAKLQAA